MIKMPTLTELAEEYSTLRVRMTAILALAGAYHDVNTEDGLLAVVDAIPPRQTVRPPSVNPYAQTPKKRGGTIIDRVRSYLREHPQEEPRIKELLVGINKAGGKQIMIESFSSTISRHNDLFDKSRDGGYKLRSQEARNM